MSKRRFKLYKNLLFSSYHPRSIGSGSYRKITVNSASINPDFPIWYSSTMSLWRVLRSTIGSYRLFTMARVRPSKGATSWPRMLLSNCLQIWRDYSERRATKKGPLFVSILELPRAQLSARIRDDRDKSNFVSVVQARKSAPIFPLEIFLSPRLLRLPRPHLFLS